MKSKLKQYTVILFGLLVLACHNANGQGGISLFAFKTNLLEWSVAVPNVSVFTDLSAKPWNRSAAGITIKYKWKTVEAYEPSFVFNLFEIRPEYRYYLKNLYLGAMPPTTPMPPVFRPGRKSGRERPGARAYRPDGNCRCTPTKRARWTWIWEHPWEHITPEAP